MAATPVTVLYVMAHGWSGSTILGNVLGELDGFVHVGELRTLWDDGLLGTGRCGCGRPVRECPFWGGVLAAGFGDPASLDVPSVARWHRDAARVRNTLALLRAPRDRPTGREALVAYLPVASRLYRAVADAAGARVVVDTSKRAGDAALLRLVPGVLPFYLHLVRDPRAVAHSWRKRGEPGRGPVATARDWTAYNLLFEAVRRREGQGRSMLLRHEDFVARPGPSLSRICRMLGERPARLPLDGRVVELGPNHTVLGNPVRFRMGRVELVEDRAWRTELPVADRAAVTALTTPLLLRYGYRFRPGA